MPIALLHVCDCPDFETSAMSVAQFERLVQWVADRAVTTAVATTDRVVGGSLKTPVGTPDADVVTAPVWSTLPQSAPAVRKGPQWHVGPIPVSQGQMLFAGLLIGLTVIVTFRTATRGQRHES